MSFIKTFSGKHFYYDKINKDDIVINDIAVSLSNICRFAGHLSHFYSVALRSKRDPVGNGGVPRVLWEIRRMSTTGIRIKGE
ncbi:hypothetical protein BRU98_002227 [Escherichia coli]|nr:hypothetical protein [Escherichia coli]